MSPSKERITVSLDAEVARALKPAAARSGAANVSQYVEDTVRERIARETWIARWNQAAGPVDPDALAYARRALLASRLDPAAADLDPAAAEAPDERPQAS
jgi:hypothetical protein